MGEKWRQIFIKPISTGYGPERLDQNFSARDFPAVVIQNRAENGEPSYPTDEKGCYEVRVFVDNPLLVRFAKGLIDQEAFKVVEEVEREDK